MLRLKLQKKKKGYIKMRQKRKEKKMSNVYQKMYVACIYIIYLFKMLFNMFSLSVDI
jgi:hypothetical protein